MEAIEIVMMSTVTLAQDYCIEHGDVPEEIYQLAAIPARHVTRRQTKEGIQYFIIDDHDRTR